MKAKLICRWGTQKDVEFQIGREATIGRAADSDVRLDAGPVSSRHARIFYEPEAGSYFIEDLGSLNGTELDGVRLARTERLGRLHLLGFGGVCEFLFIAVDRSPESTAEEPTSELALEEGTRVDEQMPELPQALRSEGGGVSGGTTIEETPVVLPAKLAAPAAAPPSAAEAAPEISPPSFTLEVVDGEETHRFPLRQGENLVGRTQGATVALSSTDLSRRHAVLRVAGDRVTVRDLGSRNHTWVDQRKVESEVELRPESVLRFGVIEARLIRDDGAASPRGTGG